MLVSLVSIVSFQPLPRTTLSNGRVSRAAASMQLPDFGKGLQNMMPGGGDDSGLSKEQAEEMEARMKTGGMTFDEIARNNVRLPDTRAGLAMVFEVAEKASYALVLKASRVLKVMDKVKNP